MTAANQESVELTLDQEYEEDPSFAIPAEDPDVLLTPSHVFASKEDSLDQEQAAGLVHQISQDCPREPRLPLTEGEAIGGLALLNIFGTKGLVQARIKLARRQQAQIVIAQRRARIIEE